MQEPRSTPGADSDYTFTSDAAQIGALHDRLASLGVPSLGLLYCAHTGWQRFLHCGLGTGGYCRRANVSASDGARRVTPIVWEPAGPVRRAGARARTSTTRMHTHPARAAFALHIHAGTLPISGPIFAALHAPRSQDDTLDEAAFSRFIFS